MYLCSTEDVKVFIKLSSKEESMLERRVFFFEENREVLLLQKGAENILKYKYDYIFSDYENNLLIASSIRMTISNLIRNNKNLAFFSFGEEKLGKSKFFFGHSNKFMNDSFFKYTYETIYSILKNEISFDNMLIDIFKISNEKFAIDYRNILYDTKYDIIDFINQILREGIRTSVSQSTQSDISYENGHLIFTLKFFKFVTDADINKEQREVEIIRTISFIDFEGFNSTFTEILLKNKNESIHNDPKNFTLLNLKNFVEAISSIDLEKYSEINSSLCNVLVNILQIHNSSILMFAFINQNENSLYESTVTLELMNKFKNLNAEYFFDVVQEMNIDLSNMNENKYFKEEYYVVDLIFSEILCYIENFKKSNQIKYLLDNDLFKNIKDLSQFDKYYYLKNWLNKMNFEFDYNAGIIIKKIFDDVLNYFHNRSTWKNLYRARDDIINLNSNMKIENPLRESSAFKSHEIIANDTHEWTSFLKILTKDAKISEDEENVSILDKSNDKNKNPYVLPEESKKKNTCGNIFENSHHKDFTKSGSHMSNIKKTSDTTAKSSIESTFMGLILKQFMKNMNKSMINIYDRFTESKKCLPCQKAHDNLENVDFNSFNASHYSLFKSGMYKANKEKTGIINNLKRDSFLDYKDNLKSTNLENITKNKDEYEKADSEKNRQKEIATKTKNVPNLENQNNNIGNAQVNYIQHRNSQSQSWSEILPSKIESGYNSESIQIFKINQKKSGNEKKQIDTKILKLEKDNHISNKSSPKADKISDPFENIQNTIRDSNFNPIVNIYKDNSFLLKINDLNKTNLNQNISIQTNPDKNKRPQIDSSICLNERISNIDQKMGNIQMARQKDRSTMIINKNINLDSRIFSANDISELEESKILQSKIFSSLNY